MKLFENFKRLKRLKGSANIVVIVLIAVAVIIVTQFYGAINTAYVGTNNTNIPNAINLLLANNYAVAAPGQTFVGDVTGNVTGGTITGTLNAPTGRGATYVIAASDSTTDDKSQANVTLPASGAQTLFASTINGLSDGSAVRVCSGNYNFTGEAIIANKTNITINMDDGAIINLGNHAIPDVSHGVLRFNTCVNLTVHGGIINGNKANQDFESFSIMLDGCSYVHMENMYQYNTPGDGYDIFSDHVWIIGNHIKDSEENSVHVENGSYIIISDNLIDGDAGAAIAVYNFTGTDHDILVTNNIITGCLKAVKVGYAAIATPPYNVEVSHNTINTMSSYGIEVATNLGLNVQVTDNIIDNTTSYGIYGTASNSNIENNNVYRSGASGIFVQGHNNHVSGNYVAYGLSYAFNILGNYNILQGNHTFMNIDSSVRLPTGIIGNQIINNDFYNDGQGADNTSYGIQAVLTTATNNLSINGNYFHSDVPKRLASAIRVTTAGGGSATNWEIKNNRIEGMATSPTSFTAGIFDITSQIWGNLGYVAPGEVRTYFGTIATLTENAFNSVDNPFGQTVRFISLNINVSTGATATTPNIDCGIGNSATTDYVTLFDDLPGETIGYYTSTIATPGTQTVPQTWNSGSANRYLNMSIKDAAATGMVATYTVTIMGN